MTALVRSSALLLALLVAHVVDHTARQHRPVPGELGIVGAAGLIAAAAVLGLAIGGRRQAAPLGVVVGAGTTLGFVAVHLLPHWGPISDPYGDAHLDALSWASMLASAATGLVMAITGARAMRSTSPAARVRFARAWTEAPGPRDAP